MILVKKMKILYKLSPLKKEDAKLLKQWIEFEDPIFSGYNYNNLNETQEILWFLLKQKKYHSKYYSIKDEKGRLLGFIGLKEINFMLKIAKLGIVIEPSYVSKGLGSQVMKDFLDICFDELKIRRIDLEVNAWNYRAINLYKKFGFKEVKEEYQEFENQQLDLKDERYKEVLDSFEVENGVIYSKIIHMSLQRQEFYDESRTTKR